LVATWTSVLSFQHTRFVPPCTLQTTSPFFNFQGVWLKFNLLWQTVPQLFIFPLCMSGNSWGDENQLSMNNLCPEPSSTFLASRITRSISRCNIRSSIQKSFLSINCHVKVCPLQTQGFYSFISKVLRLFDTHCRNTSLPLNFTIPSSNAKSSVGWYSVGIYIWLRCRKLFYFSTRCRNQDSLCQVDFDYFQNKTLSGHA
jgi:hypothetical protein